jgi:hypothetical protein
MNETKVKRLSDGKVMGSDDAYMEFLETHRGEYDYILDGPSPSACRSDYYARIYEDFKKAHETL